MSLQTNRVATPVQVFNWSNVPGTWISSSNKPVAAKILFNRFKEGISEVSRGICQLRDEHHVSHLDLPLNLTTVFFLLIEEQIKLYQSQQSPRDKEIDNLWMTTKENFAKWRYAFFTSGSSGFKSFVSQLYLKMESAGVLIPQFKEAVPLFLKLLSIPQMMDILIPAFFEDRAKSRSLMDKKIAFDVDYPQESVISAISLLTNLLHQDALWVFSAQKKAFKKLIRNLGDMLCQFDDKRFLLSTRLKELSDLKSRVMQIVQQILSIDMNNPDNGEKFVSLSEVLVQTAKLLVDETFPDLLDIPVEISSEDFPPFQLRKTHLLLDTFVAAHLCALSRFFLALGNSSNRIRQYHQGDGPMPDMIELPAPPPFIQEHLPIKDGRPSRKARRRQAMADKSRKAAVGQEKKASTVNEEVLAGEEKCTQVSFTVSPSFQGGTAQLLAAQLRPVVEANAASTELRHILWSLDHLSLLQHEMTSEILPEHNLNLLATLVGTSSRILELAYRHLSGAVFMTHNLRIVFKDLQRGGDVPKIANQLFLGSHWSRHFFQEYYEKVRFSLGTSIATPELLERLVKTAENATHVSQGEFREQLIQLLKDVTAEVESRLKLTETPVSTTEISGLSLNEKLPVGKFREFEDRTLAFLKKYPLPLHHRACLHIKQAEAAWRMLEASIKRVNEASTYKELAFRSTQVLAHLQEGVEEILHVIEYFVSGDSTWNHELSHLNRKLKIVAERINFSFYHLSFKTRYPANHLVPGRGAEIVDMGECLAQGFTQSPGHLISDKPPILWKVPNSKVVNESELIEQLTEMLHEAVGFLKFHAFPRMHQAAERVFQSS